MEVVSRYPDLESTIESASIQAKDAKAKESFEHADYLQKLLMMFCHRNGAAEATAILFNRAYSSEYFRYSNIGGDSVELSLTDEIREMIDRNPDVLKFCNPEGDVDQWIKDEVNRQDRRYW